jgi:hypothetical protein
VCKEDITINPLLQTKTVTGNGIVVPDAGYVGIGQIEVDVAGSPTKSLDKPLVPKFGNIKYFYNNRSEVGYMRIEPSSSFFDHTSVIPGETNVSLYPTALDAMPLSRSRANYMISLDGKRYPVVEVGCFVGAIEEHSGIGLSATVPDVVFPAFLFRRACLINGLETNYISVKEMGADSKTSKVYDSNVAIAYHGVIIPTGYTSRVPCLAAEAVYAKVDIAMVGSVTSYEYSLDDGETWTAATEGLVLRQVEHVMFRNAGDSTIHIGTSEGANDICTLTSNQYVAYSTVSATWYVSEEV